MRKETTLSDAMKMRGFKYAAEFGRIKDAWKLTGRYFYREPTIDSLRNLDVYVYDRMVVEVQLSRIFFWRKIWVDYSMIRETFVKGKYDYLPEQIKLAEELKKHGDFK